MNERRDVSLLSLVTQLDSKSVAALRGPQSRLRFLTSRVLDRHVSLRHRPDNVCVSLALALISRRSEPLERGMLTPLALLTTRTAPTDTCSK